jgi:hypothetical protein
MSNNNPILTELAVGVVVEHGFTSVDGRDIVKSNDSFPRGDVLISSKDKPTVGIGSIERGEGREGGLDERVASPVDSCL